MKMSAYQTKYELLREESNSRHRHIYVQVCLLIALCVMSSIAVFVTWTVIYRRHIIIPPKITDIPDWWSIRAITYANYFHRSPAVIPNNNNNNNNNTISSRLDVKQIDNEKIYPSKLGNFIYTPSDDVPNNPKLICYYAIPNAADTTYNLLPQNIDPHLCTHLNVGLAGIRSNEIDLSAQLIETFDSINALKRQNKHLKVLLWVGGAYANGFSEMVQNHANRKQFIQSLKSTLETYRLDGIDLDWEFPSAYNKERQHFSQLLHEIRREYQREHRTYLLSVAVAAPEGIAYFAYDIGELNQYADYVNIMTYDYHFYTKGTPFTGLNAPLYKRHNEQSMLDALNINATVNYWHKQGLDKNKIIIGLPTYGHSFRLVNPFNTKIGSPAEGYGSLGYLGFVSYSDVCWFKQNNFFITNSFDVETCSPFMYAGTEWVSYENEQSIECKAKYIKDNGFGGAMIFSLNTDDYGSYCKSNDDDDESQMAGVYDIEFPLTNKIKSILFE